MQYLSKKKDISKLEELLTGSQKEIRNSLTDKIDLNTSNIKLVMEENKLLKRENDQLKDRICQIEKSQLENNIMISGQPEKSWELYELTKERVFNMIAASVGSSDIESAKREAKK